MAYNLFRLLNMILRGTMRMELINLKDINLSSMNLSMIQGTTSSVYIGDGKCYKILDGLYSSEKRQLFKKFIEMDGIIIDDILSPKELIIDDGSLVGYTMEYFSDSMNLYEFFTQERFVDVNDIFEATKKASLIVRKAHESGIILQDFSFDNILINYSFDVKICDIDGCKYKGTESPFISMIMHNYYDVIMGKRYTIDENFDNQSLLFSMLLAIYHKMNSIIDDYDTLSDKIKTLKSIKSLVNSLLKNPNTKVPYLDELICDDDHFIIDRDKQVSLKNRLSKNYSIS